MDAPFQYQLAQWFALGEILKGIVMVGVFNKSSHGAMEDKI
jgi:hypothetical protein